MCIRDSNGLVAVEVYAADGDESVADEGTVRLGTDTFGESDWAMGGTRTAVLTVSPELFSGGTLIATATDADGNTSEFSNAVKINNVTVDAEAPAAIPAAWALGRVAPHPARPGARVTLDVPTSAPARLSVVDVLGREVAVLVDGPLAAGTHAVALPDLAPGAYVLRLVADGRMHARALVVTGGSR